jgi:two-component system phosphate regulon response regulator PhoB
MQNTRHSKGLVLIVEDEPSQMELLAFNLTAVGYDILRAETGEEGLLLFRENNPDLVLLDWMLPNLSGLEVCRQMKRTDGKECHIIMLTARGEEDDKIRGLDVGADDYVVKPYSIKELLARVRAGIRIRSSEKSGDSLTYGPITMDMIRHAVTVNDTMIAIGPLEFKMLKLFLASPKRVFSRDQFLERIWPDNLDVETRTVDVHVGRLRKALKSANGTDPIKTIRGFGYSLDDGK